MKSTDYVMRYALLLVINEENGQKNGGRNVSNVEQIFEMISRGLERQW